MLKLLPLLLLFPLSAYGEELKSSVHRESKELLSCVSLKGECSTLLDIPWDKPSFQFWRAYYKNRWNRLKLISLVDNYKAIYPLVLKVFKEEGLPEDLALLAIVESNGEPSAVSKAGAAGLWQLMPGTARKLGLKVNWYVDERFDILKSTRAAAKYLKELHSTFGRWDLAIAAYNAGPGRIERRLKRLGADEFWDLTRIPDETLNYVPKFYAVLSFVHEKGLLKKPARDRLITVKVTSSASLYQISKRLKVPFEKLYRYNRQYKRRVVPAGHYVYVPASFVKDYTFLKLSKGKELYIYAPKRRESLYSIARAFGVPPSLIKRLNGLNRNVVYKGEAIIIVKAGKGKGRNG